MHLEAQRVLVTGGSRGLGLGIVEALVARKARVTVLARNPKHLAEVERRLGVGVIPGDVTDPALAGTVLRDLRPTVLVLNAGATPVMASLHEQTWEQFTSVWDTDVKAGHSWMKEGRRDVSSYFTRYDAASDWHLVPAWLEGREVIAVFRDPSDPRPGYFVELTFTDRQVAAIRDFRYVPYIAAEAAFELLR